VKETLVAESKLIIANANLKSDGTGKSLADIKIWISASCQKEEINNLANIFREVFQEFGVTILSIDKDLGPIACEKIEEADIILMLAATPGISARALEILLKSRAQKTTVADKLYIYMPKEYAYGFICRRFAALNAKVKHLHESFFYEGKKDLFSQCLYDVCQETRNLRRQKMLKKSEFTPKIGIITALPVEFKFVKRILNNPRIDIVREEKRLYQEYNHGTIESKSAGAHEIVVARCGKGNIRAAIQADALIHKYPTVDVIFMVGVAAGVPNVKDAKQHVRLGDIVVCNEFGVIKYDDVKKYTKKIEYVPKHNQPQYEWLTRVENHIENMERMPPYWSYLDKILNEEREVRPRTAPLKDTPWVESEKAVKQPVVPGHDPKRPRIHSGAIGSSDTVLKSAKFRDKLSKKFKIKAIEMEASGIAEATWEHGKGYFVIRGICDFANDDKNKRWQPYAAAAAAAFTQDLIESMPLMKESKNDGKG
jgi:nucleoside phosphorylase